MNNAENLNENEKVEFVTLELARDMVHTNRRIQNQTNGKMYVPISGPNGGQFFYPENSLKQGKDDPNRIFITRPKGTEFRIHTSKDAEPTIYKIEELKAAYEANNFVNFMVPTDWAKHFNGKDGKEFVSISIPIIVDEQKQYYSFILSSNNFRDSKTEGMSYFGLPRRHEENDYNVKMTRSVKVGDSYQDDIRYCTSSQLKLLVNKAVEKYRFSNMFINIAISDKFVRPFTAKDGTELFDVTLPVNNGKKTDYYNFVLESNRVKLEDGKAMLSLFKNSLTNEPYTINAELSIANNLGGYDKVTKQFTTEEIANIYKENNARFTSEHKSNDDYVKFNENVENSSFVNETVSMTQQPQMRRHGR